MSRKKLPKSRQMLQGWEKPSRRQQASNIRFPPQCGPAPASGQAVGQGWPQEWAVWEKPTRCLPVHQDAHGGDMHTAMAPQGPGDTEGQDMPATMTPTSFFSPWFPNPAASLPLLPFSSAPCPNPDLSCKGPPQDFSPHPTISQEQHSPLSLHAPGLSLIAKATPPPCGQGPPAFPLICPLVPSLCQVPHPHPNDGAAPPCSHTNHGPPPHHPLNDMSLVQSFEKTLPRPHIHTHTSTRDNTSHTTHQFSLVS